MPLLRVPHSSSAPSLTNSMAGAMCPCPLPMSSPFGSAATRSAPSGGGSPREHIYTLVQICRQPARLGEIIAVRPDKGAMVRRVTRGASDVAGTGADTVLGAREVRQ